MAAEAIVLLGATDHYGQAFEALDAWTQAPQTPPFALLEATLGLDSDGSWLRQALPPVAQRLRDAVETFADEPAAAGAYAGDVEGWLQLTGYAGDAAAKARALRCRAVDTLTEAGETLGAAQILVAVKPPDLARLGRLREAQGRLEDAAETYEVAEMPADALRKLAHRRQVGAGRAVGRGPGAQRPGMARGPGGRDPAAARRPAQAADGRRARAPRATAGQRRAAPEERPDRGRRHGLAARHPAGARPRAAARLHRGRRHAPGPGQGADRAVLRPPRDGVPELDARLQPPVEADRRAVWRCCGRPSSPTRAPATR